MTAEQVVMQTAHVVSQAITDVFARTDPLLLANNVVVRREPVMVHSDQSRFVANYDVFNASRAAALTNHVVVATSRSGCTRTDDVHRTTRAVSPTNHVEVHDEHVSDPTNHVVLQSGHVGLQDIHVGYRVNHVGCTTKEVLCTNNQVVFPAIASLRPLNKGESVDHHKHTQEDNASKHRIPQAAEGSSRPHPLR